MDGPSDSPANDSGSYRGIRNNIPAHALTGSQRNPCGAYGGRQLSNRGQCPTCAI